MRQNRQLIASLENIANTMTWFLPERFTSSEIGTEAVAAVLGLMTVLNQHIIDTAPECRLSHHLPGSALARDHQQRCLPLATSLAAVKQLEVLVEVAAEYYKGRDKKWDILAAMEAIKACLRFLILHRNGYRMLLYGGEAIHTEEASCGVPHIGSSFVGAMMDGGPVGRQTRQFSSPGARKSSLPGGLETKATLALMKFGENAGINTKPSWTYRHQGNGENSTSPVNIPCIPKPVSKRSWELPEPEEFSAVGEWVFILRPLVYVLLIRQYGLRSWKPWLASFALEATGVTTILAAKFLKGKKLMDVADNGNKCTAHPLSSEEIQEIKRRQLLLFFYITRDPFFSMYTRPCLGVAERALRPVPLIGSIGGKVVEFFMGIQTRYCYTSGS